MSNPLRMTPQTMKLAAHRGHRAGAPENTLAAFRLARELGGEGITCETDLALTKDGQLMLIHDEMVDRTTDGHGLVQNMTMEELKALDAGSWFSPEFKGERIPTLREALVFARENGIVYQLELKVYNRNDEIFPKLKALIDELDCADLLQFSSFDFTLLKAVKEYMPEIPTVGLSHSILLDPTAPARDANVDAINLEILNFPSAEALKLHDAGFAVFLHVPPGEVCDRYAAYGLDMRARVVKWIRDGWLDQIISDDAALVRELWETANQP